MIQGAGGLIGSFIHQLATSWFLGLLTKRQERLFDERSEQKILAYRLTGKEVNDFLISRGS